jgi:predicted metal-dependent phosphoesterase TrpH
VTQPRRGRHAAPAVGEWHGVVPPAPSTIDLHTHTRRSDGVLEPQELVRQALDAGVGLLSITDHDTLAGVRELVATGGVPAGLRLVPGVEINAVAPSGEDLWEGEIHVLGFGMDLADEAFEAALAGQRAQRRLRFERILERLRDLDLGVDDAVAEMHLLDDDALGRPTVARALMARGHATSVEDAFRRLLGRGMPAYVPRDGLDPAGAIRAIRDAGGLASLAHFREAPLRMGTVAELQELGLRGLEVYYRSFDATTVAVMERVARDLGLVATGGSDYHGDLGPYVESHAWLWVPPDAGTALGVALGRL